MKEILYALILSLAVLILPPDTQAAQRFSIATGGTSGIYFPIGGAMAKAASKSGALQVTLESSNASVANINLITKTEIEMGFVQNDVTYWAYHGQNMFSQPLKNLRTVLALYPEHVHLVASKESGIKSIMDLRGKRVSVGAPGSGFEADARAVLEVAGITYNDLKADRVDIASAVNRFKDNLLDAAFFVTGYPAPGPMEIATSRAISLISMDKAFMEKLIKAYPFFVAHSIPGGTYQGVDTATETPAVLALLVTHDKMPDDAIYAFLKGVFDNLPEVHASHAKAREITLQNALDGLTAPLHPGAVKFFKEKGLTIPAIAQ